VSDNGGTVTLRLYGALRQAAGSREVPLECVGVTVKEALRHFAEKLVPRAAAMLFDRQGNMRSSLILLLNEEPAEHGPQTPIKAGDVVSVLMPLAGG
jgi:molybdopterin converting factor small subunit